MKLAAHLVFPILVLATSCVTTEPPPEKRVRLEIRLASFEATPGYKQMRVLDGQQLIYVGAVEVVGDREVVAAAVREGADGQTRIALQLSQGGAKRLHVATVASLDKPFAVMIDGKLVAAPVVREPIASGQLEISGMFDDLEALEIVDNINEGR